jgi:tetratricopeptide (TPR) repeat protein
MKSVAKIIFGLAMALSAAGLFAQEKPDARKEWLAGNYTRAIEICEEEIKVTPRNRDSYTVLCWALVDNKQYAEAEVRATAALKFAPEDVRIIEILGEAKYFLDKNGEALSLFQSYISLTREDATRLGRVYYMTGEIYIKQAKYEHADIALSMAVRLEPKMGSWWSRLGYAREMARDYRNAIVAYDKALQQNPSLADAARGKSRCQSHL